jgi:hypothetical protein
MSPRLPFLWSYEVFRYSILLESHLILQRHYLYNNYTLFMIFGYLLTLFIYMCGIINLEYAYHEYLILI